ncbi:MAG: hypothetical protein L6Q80_02390 [Dehalococcoidia bacterium]|nr:hypothetical protein [Dehalococcoidia bacterium]MCL4232560.1 hypothetical protein [Dehalococcoidia bacterium]NUN93095.1 hypothetical protein [Verrucomicrobiae bacterium]
MPQEYEFADDVDEDGPDLGPDERDRDLMDGTWEERYYSGRAKQRDWQSVYVGLALLALMGLVIPALVVVFR